MSFCHPILNVHEGKKGAAVGVSWGKELGSTAASSSKAGERLPGAALCLETVASAVPRPGGGVDASERLKACACAMAAFEDFSFASVAAA